jgi:hypothetical protein
MVGNLSTCIYWYQSDQTILSLPSQYQGRYDQVCPEHLPILIHKTNKLADTLPGRDHLSLAGFHA